MTKSPSTSIPLSLLAPLVVLAAACAARTPAPRPTPDMASAAAAAAPYAIRVGDRLDVRFFKTPELNVTKVPVRSDGKISLDLVGDVEAAGLPPDVLSRRLEALYARELDTPRVTVSVQQFGGHVYVGGEVGKPVNVPFSEGLTVLQAIEAAGGFLSSARTSTVVLIRRTGTGFQGYTLALDRALTGDEPAQDVNLQPTDIVHVPRSRIANVNLFVEQYITKNLPTIPIALF